MFIRKKTRRYRPRPRDPGGASPAERVYVSYAVVESYRDDLGRPRQRTILELGGHPDMGAALAGARQRLEELRERESASRRPDDLLASIRRRALERAEHELERLEQIALRVARPALTARGERAFDTITPPPPQRPLRGRRGRPSSAVGGAPSGLENQ